MKAPPFNYTRADHLAEVFELLIQHGADAKILAGGQSLMPALNMRLSSPAVLIDISRLQEQAGICVKDGHVHIGALTTHAAIGNSAAELVVISTRAPESLSLCDSARSPSRSAAMREKSRPR